MNLVGLGFEAEESEVVASCAAVMANKHSDAKPIKRIFCNIALILLKDEIGTASGLCQKPG